MPMWVGYALTAIGLLPLAWLGVLAARGRVLPSGWWWMAAAFGVSFVADALSLVVTHPVISQVYPVAQAGIFLGVLVGVPMAARIVAVLLIVSAFSTGVRHGQGLDVAMHVAAWGSIAVAADVALVASWLKRALVGGFAGLALAWVWFWLDPSFAAWGFVQAVRLATVGAWGYAATEASRVPR